MLSFPYQPEPLTGQPPPSMPAFATDRWRPLAAVRIYGPTGISRLFTRGLLDPGADDTIFPLDIASYIGVMLHADTGHGLRWRGQPHSLRYGDAELELVDDNGIRYRWSAVIGFSPAPIRYPILGNSGCLQFFNALYRGADKIVELRTNSSYAGQIP